MKPVEFYLVVIMISAFSALLLIGAYKLFAPPQFSEIEEVYAIVPEETPVLIREEGY